MEKEFTVTLDEETVRELEQMGQDQADQEEMIQRAVRDKIRDALAETELTRIRKVKQNLRETQTEQKQGDTLRKLERQARQAMARKATQAIGVRVKAGPAGQPPEAGQQASRKTARIVVEEYLQRVAKRMWEVDATKAGNAVDDVLHERD